MSNNEKYLLLIWKDPQTRRNFTIGKLSYNGSYSFEYDDEIIEAEQVGWELLKAFPERKIYESETLFPIFSSRLPDKKRRDIQKILEKYDLEAFDEYELLRKSGARLPIDTYELIDPILPEQQTIDRDFFIMGIRHYAACTGVNCDQLMSVALGDLLILEAEPANNYDIFAIRVLTKKGEHLGYIPRYYSHAVAEKLANGVTYSCQVVEVHRNHECSECVKVKLNMPGIGDTH